MLAALESTATLAVGILLRHHLRGTMVSLPISLKGAEKALGLLEEWVMVFCHLIEASHTTLCGQCRFICGMIGIKRILSGIIHNNNSSN